MPWNLTLESSLDDVLINIGIWIVLTIVVVIVVIIRKKALDYLRSRKLKLDRHHRHNNTEEH